MISILTLITAAQAFFNNISHNYNEPVKAYGKSLLLVDNIMMLFVHNSCIIYILYVCVIYCRDTVVVPDKEFVVLVVLVQT